MKEDETPTSIGGELQQFSLGGSPISFQDKASGGSQAWSVEECFAFDHAAARTPEAFLNSAKDVPELCSQNLHTNISTHRLIMEVDFCPVLCIPEVPVLQAFQGIGHFVWYCKAVSDLS